MGKDSRNESAGGIAPGTGIGIGAFMTTYEYDITKHPAESFREMVYFCSETGVCALENVPSNQVDKMRDLLNERGSRGWELVQVAFGKDGVVAFWKRAMR